MSGEDKIRNNQGSSMILVIVSIAVVGILCALVLTVTMTNIQMKTIDETSKSNFYNDETAINEITARLEEYSSDAMKTAYACMIQNYGDKTLTTEERQKNFQMQYMIKLSNLLSGKATGNLEKVYSVDNLRSAILTDSAQVKVTAQGATESNPYGQIVHSVDALGRRTYDYLTLKNVQVTYTNVQNYETTITTDINMTIPQAAGIDTTFANYALISDQVIHVSASAEAKGGVYGGGLKESSASNLNAGEAAAGSSGDSVNPNKGGIWVDSAAGNFSIDGNGNIVAARQNLLATNQGALSISNANVWAKNLMTFGTSDSAGTPSISINGCTHVKDDITVKADYSNITLSNEYYGFSYEGTQADESSAINVNAHHVKLDFSGLDKFVLAGRSFITSKSGMKIKDTDVLKDIFMGQSTAVKTDQAMYLVPTDDYLRISTNPITKDALDAYAVKKYGTGTEYSSLNLGDAGQNDIVDFTKEDSKAKEIYDKYLNQSQPVRPIYYKQGTGEADIHMVIYYYNFRDADAANQYIKEYYSTETAGKAAKGSYNMKDGFSKAYEGFGFVINPNIKRLQMAGEMLVRKNGEIKLVDASVSGLENESVQKAEKYQSVELNLREDGYATKTLDDHEYVDSIVNLSNLMDTAKIPDGVKVITTTVSGAHGNGKVILTNQATYQLEKSGSGILIASGDVSINTHNIEWEGVIIANGKIEVTASGGNASFTANEQLVLDVLNYCRQNKNILGDFLYAYSDDKAGKAGEDTIDYASAISFENWRKGE